MIESDEEVFEGTPPEIASAAKEVTLNLLPVKSRKLYEKAYAGFVKWCGEKSVIKYTESVLLAHFSEQSQVYKASSLWSYYSKIKSMLLINENVDISKFPKLIAFQVLKFIHDAPNDVYLMTKVAAIMGVAGAMRCNELLNLSIDDIQEEGGILYVDVKDTVNFIELYKMYTSLRPAHTNHRRFFIFYKNGKCSTQVVGKNKLGKIPAVIAGYLKLPNPQLYTGHCLRRSSATLLANSGADLTTVKRHGGWKSSTVAEGYIESSTSARIKIAGQVFGESGAQYCVPGTSARASETTSTSSTRKDTEPGCSGASAASAGHYINIVNANNINITIDK